jgi:hypothetical protein
MIPKWHAALVLLRFISKLNRRLMLKNSFAQALLQDKHWISLNIQQTNTS